MLVTLNAITTKITKGTTPTSVGCTFENSGVNYIKSESLGSSRNINKSKFAFISEQTHEKLKRSQIEKNDILFSMAGMFLGKTGIVTADLVPANTNQAVAIIRIDNEKANHEYVYYYLNLKSVMQAINASSAQSAQPNINLKQIGQLEIDLPGRKVQDKIVSILSAIDFKIEKNKQINENLEQQAVVLFRSWFSAFSLSPNSPRVNSEFGEIPEDFTVIKVGSLPILVTDYVSNGSFASLKANVSLYQEPNYAYFIRNTDLKSGSFGVFVDQHSYEFLSKSTLYGGEIIISNVGDVGSVFLCPKLDAHMTLGNNIIMLRPEDDHLRYYLYIWFKYLQGQALIQGIKGGSAQPKFNKTDFKNTSILIPPKDILSRFHETVAPMFEMISHRQTETSRLANLRDTLLPHLMSGEIDVSKLDI